MGRFDQRTSMRVRSNGSKTQLDAPADERGVDLVGVGEQAHRRRLGDGAGLGPQERLVQLRGVRVAGRAAGSETLERGHLRLRVHGAVIDGLDPGGEQLVEPGDVVDLGVADFDEELVAHRAKEPLDLAASLRAAGPGVDRGGSPTLAHARSSWAETNGLPLST